MYLDDHRRTLTALLLVFCVFGLMFTAACSWTSVLAEGEKILGYIPLAVNIALPIVCAVDVAVCPAVTAATSAVTTAQAAVLQLFQQWQAASTAAAPGILAQLQAALTALQTQTAALLAAAHVSNAQVTAEVMAILAAVTAGISQIATITGVTLTAGGTQAAAARVIRANLGVYVVKRGPLTMTSKDFKNAVKSAVSQKTGHAGADALNAKFVNDVKGW